ncbi:MAG: AMP-binding protein [Gammaproteobacteria bacterium]|nr:AMP-binding protein [Gammaproteobacteria bacterium]
MNESTGTPPLSRIGPKIPVDPELPFHDSLVHMFWHAVEGKPDVTAVIFRDRTISYREFGRAVNGLDAKIRSLDLPPGPIVIMMANSIEMDVALMAVMSTCAPVNPFFTVAEVGKVLTGFGATAILCDPGVKDKADAVAANIGVEHVVVIGEGGETIEQWTGDASLDKRPSEMPGPDDLALSIFTGGSTGVPKGVDHTHRGLMWGLVQHVSVWPIPFGEGVFLNVAPMFHIWGLGYATWVPIYTAGTLVMIPKYEPDEVVRGLAEHRVSIFAGGPAPIYLGLLKSPLFDQVDLSALKYCISGGAPCPEELHREWLKRTGCPLLEGWGMSEGAPFCLNLYDGERKMLKVGNPVPETEVEIVDLETGTKILPMGETGEVRVRGPQMMTGYHGKPEETAIALRDGFMYTGDIGYVDEDGFLALVDRKKDMVLVGGYNVYPREVDEVLYNHPAIREAATVGKKDDRLGEVVVAFVARKPGVDLDEESFFAYCKENLVKYKRPVEVTFIDALPRTRTNKIDRLTLRKLAAEPKDGAQA